MAFMSLQKTKFAAQSPFKTSHDLQAGRATRGLATDNSKVQKLEKEVLTSESESEFEEPLG